MCSGGAVMLIAFWMMLTVFTRLSAAPDWAPPPNEPRIWDQIFLKSAAPEWAPPPNERRIWDQIFLKSAAPEWAPH
jgi:hypothetical protein